MITMKIFIWTTIFGIGLNYYDEDDDHDENILLMMSSNTIQSLGMLFGTGFECHDENISACDADGMET